MINNKALMNKPPGTNGQPPWLLRRLTVHGRPQHHLKYHQPNRTELLLMAAAQAVRGGHLEHLLLVLYQNA
jgi:hypothetical protein